MKRRSARERSSVGGGRRSMGRVISQIVRSYVAAAWSVALLVVMLPLGLAAWPFDRQHRVYGRLSVMWARSLFAILGLRVAISGSQHIEPGERYIVVSNHQSLLDPVVLVQVLQPHVSIRFVSKRSVFAIPMIGWIMKLYGHLAIDRRNLKRSMAEMARAADIVQGGHSTVFFPEGTRTRTGALSSFQTGAFRVAAAAQVPVLPVSLDGSFQALPPKGRMVRSPGVVTVRIHPPLPAPGSGHPSALAARDRCHAIVAGGLAAMRQGA